MKKISTLFFLFISLITQAQTWSINVLTDSISINGPFSDSRNILFSNRQTRYTDPIRKMGLHFRNGQVNSMTNQVRISNLMASPILGAHGLGTELVYNGDFQSDEGQSFPSIAVLNGGKFTFGPQARIDLVLPGSFFTRQFWCLGDGTGTIEFAPGFVADRSQAGAADSGLGSIRLSNCKLISHESQGLPLGYRPNPSMINAHLVFENEPGSTWITKTNPQTYLGGLWVRKNMSIETQTSLHLSGKRSVWSDYTNFGGIFLEDSGLVVTKKGPAILYLDGEQAYAKDAKIRIEEGEVHFLSEPYSAADSAFYAASNRKSGQNLEVELAGSGIVHFAAPESKIRKLNCHAQSTVKWTKGKIKAKAYDLAGKLEVILDAGNPPFSGQILEIFDWQNRTGTFSSLVLPALSGLLVWDSSYFYSEGKLKITEGLSARNLFEKPFELPFPNPASQTLNLPTEIQSYFLWDMNGKLIFQWDRSEKQTKALNIQGLKNGVYQMIWTAKDGTLRKSKMEILH